MHKLDSIKYSPGVRFCCRGNDWNETHIDRYRVMDDGRVLGVNQNQSTFEPYYWTMDKLLNNIPAYMHYCPDSPDTSRGYGPKILFCCRPPNAKVCDGSPDHIDRYRAVSDGTFQIVQGDGKINHSVVYNAALLEKLVKEGLLVKCEDEMLVRKVVKCFRYPNLASVDRWRYYNDGTAEWVHTDGSISKSRLTPIYFRNDTECPDEPLSTVLYCVRWNGPSPKESLSDRIRVYSNGYTEVVNKDGSTNPTSITKSEIEMTMLPYGPTFYKCEDAPRKLDYCARWVIMSGKEIDRVRVYTDGSTENVARKGCAAQETIEKSTVDWYLRDCRMQICDDTDYVPLPSLEDSLRDLRYKILSFTNSVVPFLIIPKEVITESGIIKCEYPSYMNSEYNLPHKRIEILLPLKVNGKQSHKFIESVEYTWYEVDSFK